MEFTLLVLGIPKSRVGAKLVLRYAKDLTPDNIKIARKEIAFNQAMNRFETGGRPSKKNRRDLMDFIRSKSCLLYTSPSPRDRTRSRMPSSA